MVRLQASEPSLSVHDDHLPNTITLPQISTASHMTSIARYMNCSVYDIFFHFLWSEFLPPHVSMIAPTGYSSDMIPETIRKTGIVGSIWQLLRLRIPFKRKKQIMKTSDKHKYENDNIKKTLLVYRKAKLLWSYCNS